MDVLGLEPDPWYSERVSWKKPYYKDSSSESNSTARAGTLSTANIIFMFRPLFRPLLSNGQFRKLSVVSCCAQPWQYIIHHHAPEHCRNVFRSLTTIGRGLIDCSVPSPVSSTL